MSERGKGGAKVGLIGTGMVGSSFAYALMQSGLAGDLVLLDLDRRRAEGEAMDLNHGVPFVRPLAIRAGEYDDLAGASVVVICAGSNQRPGETRLDLLQKNAAVFREIVPRVVSVCPDAVLVIATNPVDILAHISVEMAGLPPGRVIGSGTILDTARLRFLLGEHYGVDPRNVHAHIVGEHGDSELALWSLAHVGGIPLREFVGPGGLGYEPSALERIFARTRDAAYEIIERKKATYYAIGLGLRTIVEAILRDQNTILTVSQPMTGQHGLEDVSLSLPCIVGRRGVHEVLDVPMSEAEADAFRRSGQVLRERLEHLRTSD